MKVYCKNCKWLKKRKSIHMPNTCWAEAYNGYGKDIYIDVNSNGNCKHYKRKWWKFLIKNERIFIRNYMFI